MNDNEKPIPVPESPNRSNMIGEIFLYYDRHYGINVMYQYDGRKFRCPAELSEDIMKNAAQRLLESIKQHNLFGAGYSMVDDVDLDLG